LTLLGGDGCLLLASEFDAESKIRLSLVRSSNSLDFTLLYLYELLCGHLVVKSLLFKFVKLILKVDNLILVHVRNKLFDF
jgi:hypothetical protein